MYRNLQHKKEAVAVEQKNEVGLLSSELQVEAHEMRSRGRHGPDHEEICKPW